VKSRTRLTTSDKPATPRKVAIAKLVPSSEPNIDDEAEERARGGVQSLGRAFSILEEVARHREGSFNRWRADSREIAHQAEDE